MYYNTIFSVNSEHSLLVYYEDTLRNIYYIIDFFV